MSLGDYTRAAKVQKAAELEEHWDMLRRARDYARSQPRQGPRAHMPLKSGRKTLERQIKQLSLARLERQERCLCHLGGLVDVVREWVRYGM